MTISKASVLTKSTFALGLLIAAVTVANAEPASGDRPTIIPKAKVGVDDDSLRPKNTLPLRSPPSSLPGPNLSPPVFKGKIGTDDDSVHPVRPPAKLPQ